MMNNSMYEYTPVTVTLQVVLIQYNIRQDVHK